MSDIKVNGQAPRRHASLALLAAIAAVSLVAATGLGLGGCARRANPSAAPAPVVTPTATSEPTAPVVATSTPVATVTPVPATVREDALITKVTGSSSKGYTITIDTIEILTGEAAADAADAAGDESPPPNDYYIVNKSRELRTLTLPKDASITVLGWGGREETAKTRITIARFMSVIRTGRARRCSGRRGATA